MNIENKWERFDLNRVRPDGDRFKGEAYVSRFAVKLIVQDINLDAIITVSEGCFIGESFVNIREINKTAHTHLKLTPDQVRFFKTQTSLSNSQKMSVLAELFSERGIKVLDPESYP